MNELNLKDISKETTKGPTKAVCKTLQTFTKSSHYYSDCNWYLIKFICMDDQRMVKELCNFILNQPGTSFTLTGFFTLL